MFAFHPSSYYYPRRRTAWEDMVDLLEEPLMMPHPYHRYGYGHYPHSYLTAPLRTELPELWFWGDTWPTWGGHHQEKQQPQQQQLEKSQTKEKMPQNDDGMKAIKDNNNNNNASTEVATNTTGKSDTTVATHKPTTRKLFDMSHLTSMAIDVVENENNISIHADLPGVQEKDVDVRVDEARGLLHISAKREQVHEDKSGRLHRIERSYGSMQRSIPIPRAAVSETGDASFANGVLTIQFAKRPVTEEKTENGPKKLMIHTSKPKDTTDNNNMINDGSSVQPGEESSSSSAASASSSSTGDVKSA